MNMPAVRTIAHAKMLERGELWTFKGDAGSFSSSGNRAYCWRREPTIRFQGRAMSRNFGAERGWSGSMVPTRDIMPLFSPKAVHHIEVPDLLCSGP